MGARSGGGRGSIRRPAGKNRLSPAANSYLDLVHLGKFDKISYNQKKALLKQVDRQAEKLTETRRMYKKEGVWDSIELYQKSGYKLMNDRAMGKKTGDKEVDMKIKMHMDNLDRAIQMRKTTKDMVVWRGSSKAEKDSRRYVSVSLKARASNDFRRGKNLHAFLIPKGTPYAYSNRMGEEEMILPRGFKLQKYKIK